MSVFNIISLLGGLAMFLYGMKLMGNCLKEGASGSLKKAMEAVTNNPVKAFLLGLVITAVIQSSTATIVITAGLVAAGVITLRQSLGIIVGANVGTTVTGQIIRLLDVSEDSTSWLKIFQPSTLAPLALIAGIIFIMFLNSKVKKADTIGGICVGFGILFSGLLNMTSAVSILSENGVLDSMFSAIGNQMWLGYLVGFVVSFILQSSSATVGILQAFSMASVIPFKTVYVMLLGIYLGDCLTTAIVIWIGAKADPKRVALTNVIFNLGKTVLVLVGVLILNGVGVISGMWNGAMTSGSIANLNTIFNIVCAIVLLPFMTIFEKWSKKLVKDDAVKTGKYEEKLQSLNPAFFATPALALNSCYDVLSTMFALSVQSIYEALDNIRDYKPAQIEEIMQREEDIDMLTDHVGNYLVELSPHIKTDEMIRILNQYNKLVNEFERMGDHAINIAEVAMLIHDSDFEFSDTAIAELSILRELLNEVIFNTKEAFEKRDVDAARHIEPLEDVMDEVINTLHDNHLERLREGKCTINGGTAFLDVLTNVERLSDLCSNIGISVIARVNPSEAALAHNYVIGLHDGSNEEFNSAYKAARADCFAKLAMIEKE